MNSERGQLPSWCWGPRARPPSPLRAGPLLFPRFLPSAPAAPQVVSVRRAASSSTTRPGPLSSLIRHDSVPLGGAPGGPQGRSPPGGDDPMATRDPDERYARKKGRKWIISLPPELRAHLGITPRMALFWHYPRRGEAVLALEAQRKAGAPLR